MAYSASVRTRYPLATAYATAGMLGWERDLTSTRFRAVWLPLLLIGTAGASLGLNPVRVILAGQVLNLLLLPVVVVILLYFMNNRSLMGEHTNGLALNALATVITVIIVGISLQSLISVLSGVL